MQNKNKICRIKKSPAEKAETMEQYKLHKLRAKHFYGLLSKNEDEVLTVSIDMQLNQPLPMLKISETFYARQIWLYNITFVVKDIDEENKVRQNVGNTFIYTWTEAQSPRGSNEIVSALHNLLPILKEKARLHAQAKNVELPMTLQLFSDATSSQNKNTTMMAYLFYPIAR